MFFRRMTDTAFKVVTEAPMYHAIVKRIALQNFLRVNQKAYDPILRGCSSDVHHRFLSLIHI